MMAAWSHLIRFQTGQTVYYGDAVFPQGSDPTDIVSIAESGQLQARIIEGDSNPISIVLAAKPGNRVVAVEKLLSPLSRDQVPIIRCIGLNYMKHST
jgi:hypothetical protein